MRKSLAGNQECWNLVSLLLVPLWELWSRGLWFSQIPSVLELIKDKCRFVSLLPHRYVGGLSIWERTSFCVYQHLGWLQVFVPFPPTCLLSTRGIDSRAAYHSRQSVALFRGDRLPPGSWLCHEICQVMTWTPTQTSVKCLPLECVIWSIPHPTPWHSFPHWPCSNPRSELPGLDPVLAESATSSECSKGPSWQAYLFKWVTGSRRYITWWSS